MKKKFEDSIYKRFIGFVDTRDEYQKKEINHILAMNTVYTFYLAALFLLVSLAVDTMHHTLTVGTISLFFLLEIMSVYIMTKIRKKGLDHTEWETEDEYQQKLTYLRKKSIFLGVQWGGCMFFMMDFLFPYLKNEMIGINWYSLLIWSFAGALFGMSMYFINKSKLIKV